MNFSQFDEDREDIIAEMKEKGIATITVGTDLKTSKEAVALSQTHDHLFATIGIHPTDANESFDKEAFEKLFHPKVVAVGECGLDYYRGLRSGGEADPTYKEKQKKIFIDQIEFARSHNLPLMLHCRASAGTMDAYEDILQILTTNKPQLTTGNVHFFAGDIPIAKRFLDLGFSLSFDGPVTFTNDYDEVIKFIPKDMIMAETDAPFAAPVPYRGKRNSPLYVEHVAKRLAQIRGEDEGVFLGQLVENAVRVFNLGNPLQ